MLIYGDANLKKAINATFIEHFHLDWMEELNVKPFSKDFFRTTKTIVQWAKLEFASKTRSKPR